MRGRRVRGCLIEGLSEPGLMMIRVIRMIGERGGGFESRHLGEINKIWQTAGLKILGSVTIDK